MNHIPFNLNNDLQIQKEEINVTFNSLSSDPKGFILLLEL